MAWINITNVNIPESAYIDCWDAELASRRWYRKLDRDSGTYLCRYEQDNPAQSTLFASAAVSGRPAELASNEFLVSDHTGQLLYDTAVALTADLAGLLMDVGRAINAVQADAGQFTVEANNAVETANERKVQIAGEDRAAERNRLIRQGLRALLDASERVSNWVTLTVAVNAPYRTRLRSITTRIREIVNALYPALQ